MPRRTVRVEVPGANPDDLVTLGTAVLAKHDSLEKEKAGSSPLRAAEAQVLRDTVGIAATERRQAKDYERQAQLLNEQATRRLGLAKDQNTLTPGTARTVLTTVRDRFLADNRGTENALEAWGFTVVVGTASAPKKKPAAA